MPLNCGIVGLPNVGKAPSSTPSPRPRPRPPTTPSAPSTPTPASSPCPMSGSTKSPTSSSPSPSSPPPWSSSTSPASSRARRKGEGLGNQFLGHIRATDAICHVVRCFDDPEVVHVAGGVNPLHDIDIINTELLLADLDTVEKRHAKVEKLQKPRTPTTRSKPSSPSLQKLLAALNAGKPARTVDLHRRRTPIARDLFLHHRQAAALRRQRRRSRPLGTAMPTPPPSKSAPPKKAAQVVRICGAHGSRDRPARARRAQRVPRGHGPRRARPQPPHPRRLPPARPHHLLHRRRAGGPRLDHPPRHQSPRRSRRHPLRLRKRLHQGRLLRLRRPLRLGSEQAVKEKGLLRSEGKEYVVKDGDILFFKFNV